MATMFSKNSSWTLHDNINVIIQLWMVATADDNVKVQLYAIEDNIHVNILTTSLHQHIIQLRITSDDYKMSQTITSMLSPTA